MKKFVKSVAAICAAAMFIGSVPIISLGAETDTKSVSIAPKEGVNTVKITTEEATPFDGVVIYAVYEGQSLSSVEAKEFKSISSEQDSEVQFDKAYTKASSKLFVWNSLSGMVPYNVTVVPEKVQIATAAKVEISGDTTAPSTLTATVSAINDSGFDDINAFTYEWKKGEDTLSETGATLADAVEGNYTVTAIYNGSGNYEGSITTASPYVVSPVGDTREDITGDETVSVSISASSQTAPSTLTAQISAGEKELAASDFTYVWSRNGSPISGGENGTLEDAQAGDYTVVATVKSDNVSYKGSTAASQAVTIKAVYTVTFNTDGGSSVNPAQATDGEPVAQPETPTKEHYDFAGWYKETSAYDFSTPVTDNITLTAHWTIKQYTVTFDTDGGNAIQAVTQDYNTTTTLPTPTKDGYTFVKWNDGTTDYSAGATYTITGNVTITASWTENQADTYTVRWLDDDNSELYKDENIASGTATPTHPDPTKAESEQYTYTFAGWTPAVAATVTGNAEYKATYTPVAKQFDVIYTTTHGTTPTNVKYTYGVGIAALPELTDGDYNLVGWYSDEARTQEVKSIGTSDFGAKTLYAKWQAKTPDIQIDFENEQLTGFAADSSYTIDSNAVEPAEGKLSADDYIGKTISIVKKATSPDIDSEAQSLTVNARPAKPTGLGTQEETAANEGNGKITGVTTAMEYMLSTGDTWHDVDGTTIDNLAGGTYYVRIKATSSAFASENATVTVATHGLETVTFKNEDGTVLDTQQLAIGATPVYSGATPTKAATAEYTYTFKGWSPEITTVAAGGAEYTATYTATKNKYTITWLNDDDTQIDTTEVAYGEVPTHADPSKTNPNNNGYEYTFTGWDPTPVAVTGTANYKATFSASAKTFDITYNTNGHGTAPTEKLTYTYAAGLAELPEVTETGYTFEGWYTAIDGNDKVESITAEEYGDKVLYAHWTINSYAITNNSATDDGTKHGTITLGGLDGDNKAEYNSTITVTPTADDGYELKKITVNNADITEKVNDAWQFTVPAENATVTATFGKKAVKSVTVTGAARVQKGKTSDYTATVTATDDTDVTSVYESDITWSVDETSAAAETAISGGTLTVSKNQTDDITVKAAIGDKYGTATVTPTTQRPDALEIVKVTVPTNHSTTQGSAIDGDTATNYFSDRKPTYLTAELAGVKNVSSVEIYFFTAGRKYDFDIQTSVDGTYWDKAGTFQSSGAATNFETFEFTARNAKYVRYVGNGYESNTGNAIIEFEVYGSDTAAEEAVLLTISEDQILTATNTQSDYPASNAFDNDPDTRWNAGAATPQVLTVDLLARRVVSAVEVLFVDPPNRSHKFTVEVSTNGSTWMTVADYNNDNGIGKTLTGYDEGNRISFEPKTARYIRFNGYGCGTSPYTGLREFKIYGSNDILPEPTQQTLTLVGASAEQPTATADYAIDGLEDTRWAAMVDYSNDKTKENTITFDLAKTKCISAAEIYFYDSANRNYQFDIWVSNDGTMWQKAGTYISSKQSKYESFEFEPINARYVQYAGRALGIDKSYNGFWEFRVYGFDEADEKVPDAPTTSTTNLKATYAEDSKTVTWDAFDGASYYTVEYQKYGVTQAVSDKLTDCTYTDSDGGDYGYVVKGYKVTGELIAQSEMVGAEDSAYYYVTADMNDVTTFNRVDIDWNGDSPSDYVVASSSDGVTWTKMDNNSTESNTVSSFSFENPFYVYKDYNARYVRVISETDISDAVISVSKKNDVSPAGSSMLFQKADGTDIKSSNTVNIDARLNVKNVWPSACLYWDVAEAKTYDFDEANIIIPLSNASDISRVEIGAYYAYPGDGQEFKRTSFAKNYKISYINSAEGTVNANSDGWQELESGDATGKGRLIANFDSVKATHVKFTMSGGEVKGANDNKIATFLSYIGVYTSDDIDSTSTSGSYTAGNE